MSDLTKEEEAVVEHLSCSRADVPLEQASDARELLEKLLVCLRPDERLVISLLHLQEFGTEQVSRMTGWSISLVKVKAFRSRRKMRKCWQTLLKGERP
jgi:RNA polymerase sigma-70 factor (ECF subfamily)